MTLLRLFVFLALLCAVGLAQGGEFTGKAVTVIDGDTLLVLRNGQPVKVRLAGIDAPEKAQAYGEEAKRSLAELVLKRQVRVVTRAVDDYGRLVALVEVDGLSVNEEQLRRGMAWEYSRFHDNKPYLALQREAQRARRGLWAAGDTVEPSKWRKAHPSVHPQPATEAGCGTKHYCSQMASCEEARFYLEHCGAKSLDGNGDGVPCESLCGGRP